MSDRYEPGRRELLIGLVGLLGVGCRPARVRRAGARRRRHRRRVRRRVRRRIRRRVAWRVIGGRRRLVVPAAVAVGWELTVGGRVVVVHQVRPTVIVVRDSSGRSEEIEVHREDTPDNRAEQPGSVLPDTDRSTPSREEMEEVEE